MTERYLTITLQPDWKGALRAIGQSAAKAETYQGEVLNFEIRWRCAVVSRSVRWNGKLCNFVK